MDVTQSVEQLTTGASSAPARIRVGIFDEHEMFAREIASNLGYSHRTIKSVIREIQLAPGTGNRVRAVAEDVRQGLIGMGADP